MPSEIYQPHHYLVFSLNWVGTYKNETASIFCQMSVFSSAATDLTTIKKVGFVYRSSRLEMLYWSWSWSWSCKFCKIYRKTTVTVSCEFVKFLGASILQAEQRLLPLYLSWSGIFLLKSQCDYIFTDIVWNVVKLFEEYLFRISLLR